jgi:hypothetical protein
MTGNCKIFFLSFDPFTTNKPALACTLVYGICIIFECEHKYSIARTTRYIPLTALKHD